MVQLYKLYISPASLFGLVCQVCQSDYRVEMHNVRHLKNIDPEKSYPDKLTMLHRRKQIPMCRSCYISLHYTKSEKTIIVESRMN